MLAIFQNVLMRLVVDEALRRQFALAPPATLAAFDLTSEEAATLQTLTPQSLEAFARSLLSKRWSQVQVVIPLSRRVCPSLPERYRRWLAMHPAPVAETRLSPGAAEALRALPALHAALGQDQAEAVYVADLLAFEVLQHCARLDGQPRWLRSPFALHELAQDLARGVLPLEAERRPSHYHFDRRGMQWQPQTTSPRPG